MQPPGISLKDSVYNWNSSRKARKHNSAADFRAYDIVAAMKADKDRQKTAKENGFDELIPYLNAGQAVLDAFTSGTPVTRNQYLENITKTLINEEFSAEEFSYASIRRKPTALYNKLLRFKNFAKLFNGNDAYFNSVDDYTKDLIQTRITERYQKYWDLASKRYAALGVDIDAGNYIEGGGKTETELRRDMIQAETSATAKLGLMPTWENGQKSRDQEVVKKHYRKKALDSKNTPSENSDRSGNKTHQLAQLGLSRYASQDSQNTIKEYLSAFADNTANYTMHKSIIDELYKQLRHDLETIDALSAMQTQYNSMRPTENRLFTDEGTLYDNVASDLISEVTAKIPPLQERTAETKEAIDHLLHGKALTERARTRLNSLAEGVKYLQEQVLDGQLSKVMENRPDNTSELLQQREALAKNRADQEKQSKAVSAANAEKEQLTAKLSHLKKNMHLVDLQEEYASDLKKYTAERDLIAAKLKKQQDVMERTGLTETELSNLRTAVKERWEEKLQNVELQLRDKTVEKQALDKQIEQPKKAYEQADAAYTEQTKTRDAVSALITKEKAVTQHEADLQKEQNKLDASSTSLTQAQDELKQARKARKSAKSLAINAIADVVEKLLGTKTAEELKKERKTAKSKLKTAEGAARKQLKEESNDLSLLIALKEQEEALQEKQAALQKAKEDKNKEAEEKAREERNAAREQLEDSKKNLLQLNSRSYTKGAQSELDALKQCEDAVEECKERIEEEKGSSAKLMESVKALRDKTERLREEFSSAWKEFTGNENGELPDLAALTQRKAQENEKLKSLEKPKKICEMRFGTIQRMRVGSIWRMSSLS